MRYEESKKLGCCYRLTWRELTIGDEVVAAVTVKNAGKHCKDDDDHLLHGDGSDLSSQHTAKLTNECKALVRKQLLMGLSNEVILRSASQI
jgi:hypothetical protein